MIKLGISVTLVVVLLVGAVVLFVVMGSVVRKPTAQAEPVTCVATLAAGIGGPQAGTLDDEQRGVVGQIIAIGKQRKLIPRAWQIAIQAGKTESNLRNLDHGDRDSLGVFQMRPSMGWGTREQVTNVEYAVNKFYDVLMTVPGWETMRPGDAAQRVERSAFPQRYHEHEAFAASILQELGGVSAEDLTGCRPTGGALGENPYAAKAIEYARSKFGRPYVWGAKGPEEFDCSGLVQAAYKHAGLAVPGYSGDQYNSGKHIPVAEAQPGDLIFWADAKGNPEAIHHVAIYVGNGEVIHAPQDGDVVKQSKIWQNGLVPMATRPGVK